MSLAGILGIKEPPKMKIDDPEKRKSISPFDFANAIWMTKEQLIVDEWSEKQYNSFIVNRALSMGFDTVIAANEMNARPHIEKKVQFDFLIHFVRAKKRYNKWLKLEKPEDLDVVKEYYGYSDAKARSALRILTPENIQYIRDKLSVGGRG